jgi:FkbM family methyltransferase
MSSRNTDLSRRYEALVKSVPTRSPIFLPTEKVPLRQRVYGLERVKAIYNDRLDSLYRPRLRELREQYKNKERCFVIGNGPSLNQTDLSMLKDEITFAVNGFFLKVPDLNWTPTFYVVEDHLVAEDRQVWINKFKGPTKLFPVYLAYCLDEGEDTIFFNHQPRISYPHGFDFSTDAEKVTYTGCTVTNTCLQLASYLGFKEIYLIGVDASYAIPSDADQGGKYGVGILDMKSDDPNHFHPDYFGKGFRWHDPQVDKMLEAYQEARKVTDTLGQRIINATIGGKLEVFERRKFSDIFPGARSPQEVQALNDAISQRASSSLADPASSCLAGTENICAGGDYPKVLLFDLTRIGDGTATGEIKKNLFADWPQTRLLQFYSSGAEDVSISDFLCDDEVLYDLDYAFERISEFSPDVILYRPVPENAILHELAMEVIRRTNLPLLSWIMDDWPSRLKQENPDYAIAMEADLREVLWRSKVRLSICSSMSAAFKDRYGCDFQSLANGIIPSDWANRKPAFAGKPVVVRYAGSLASNMSLHSVVRVAKTIEALGDKQEIVFEIRTPKTWAENAASQFSGLSRTRILTDLFSDEEYRRWLQGADILIIAYNFDPKSVEYVRYSMANKMPECLASGAITLAHGPREIATIDYLSKSQCAAIVAEPSENALAEEMGRLIDDLSYRRALLKKARETIVEKHNLLDLRKELASHIRLAKTEQNHSDLVTGMKFCRAAHAHLDETHLIAALLEDRPPGSIMLDVGAHFGSSAAPFCDKGWQVYCFEPDPANRQKLLERFNERPNVKIDPRAVSDHVELEKPFYSSQESTGISGLLAFRDSHEVVEKVSVTTIGEVIAEQSIQHVDFLKIDVEGYDFSVLKGVPWDKIRPTVIECEFEDGKTKYLGHVWQDICEYLVAKDYTIYVSEWHPIIRYGTRHDWLGIKRYPCQLDHPESWGNLLAFRDAPSTHELTQALEQVLSINGLSKAAREEQLRSHTSQLKEKLRKRRLYKQFSSYAAFAEWLRDTSPRLFYVGQRVARGTRSFGQRGARGTRSSYAAFAEWLRDTSPRLFYVGQRVARGMRSLRRRK